VKGALDTLSDEVRRALVVHWKRRAASELRIGRGFAALVPRLRAMGAPAVVTEGCMRSATDEERHAELCLSLAARYAGTDPGRIVEHPFEMPDFRTGDERLELLYLVTGTCCINETLAVAYIQACLDTATDPVAVATNREHLRDEIGHGRLGWALLCSPWMDAELREALAERLPRLLDANVPLWLRPDPALDEDGVPSLGHPPLDVVRRAIRIAVREVLLPGFDYVGIPASRLRETDLFRRS
jgi:hypothetical protein